ncbi:hypothetical protein [Nostoc sp.]|uniref:hypothetical protein n=1 Tax=Nostoc sp. TaxID=1180 RepID=UPI002FF55015
MEASAVNPINGGVNPLSAGRASNLYSGSSFAANDSLSAAKGSLLTAGSNLLLGNGSNPIPGGGINPFAGDGGTQLQQLIFDRLKLILGDNFFKGIDNTLAGGSNPFAGSGYPVQVGLTTRLQVTVILLEVALPTRLQTAVILLQVLEACFNNRLLIR